MLYFTHRRDPRRTDDLAVGWGSNSQYRTKFHRFYDDPDGLHLNWDGAQYLEDGYRASEQDANADLPLERRRELLLHRYFVIAPLPADEDKGDWFPYGDRLTLRTATWPLEADAVLPDPGH
ncbi:hypothetical protein [Actinoallomurus vinaceus]